jgi:cytochrome c peroxidase
MRFQCCCLLALSSLMSGRAETLPVPLGLDAFVPAPETNPLTRAKVSLGRELFFYRGLSADRSLSCASCHIKDHAFTDGKRSAVGVGGQVNARRTPAIVNRAWGRSFFWDGRAQTLEDQVLQPVLNPKEMGLKPAEIVDRVRDDAALRARMRDVFSRDVEAEDVAKALSSYVRSIVSGDSPYDRFVAGDASALTSREQEGLKLFRGKANCIACHVGPNLTDERFHNTGTAWTDGRWTDQGRAAVSGDAADRGAFKTPSLREVASAAPYMHDGSLKTLGDVIDFYDRGGRENPALDAEIRPLRLTESEKGALEAFLRTLSGKVVEGWPSSP